MKAVWTEREDGTHILVVPDRSTVLAELIPVQDERCDIWILDRIHWTSTWDLESARLEAVRLIRRTCGEILLALSENQEEDIQ